MMFSWADASNCDYFVQNSQSQSPTSETYNLRQFILNNFNQFADQSHSKFNSTYKCPCMTILNSLTTFVRGLLNQRWCTQGRTTIINMKHNHNLLFKFAIFYFWTLYINRYWLAVLVITDAFLVNKLVILILQFPVWCILYNIIFFMSCKKCVLFFYHYVLF